MTFSQQLFGVPGFFNKKFFTPPFLPVKAGITSQWTPRLRVSSFLGSVSNVQDNIGTLDLAQSTGTAQPTLGSGIDGNPTISFNGSSQFLRTATVTWLQPVFVMIVYRWNGTQATTAATIFDGTTINSMLFFRGDNINAGVNLSRTTALDTWLIASCQFNRATSRIWVNGGIPNTGNVGTSNGNGLTVGAKANAAAFAKFELAELLVRPGIPTVREHNYLGFGLKSIYPSLTWVRAS